MLGWQWPRLHKTCCRCSKTVGASQPQGADDVENVHGRNTTVKLYQEEVWEGTCNCLGPECVGWLIAAWQQVYLLTSHLRKHHVLTSLKCWYCYSTPDVVVIQPGLDPSGIVYECTVRQLGTEGEETSWGVSCTFPPKNMWRLPSICSYALWCGAWSQEWWTHVVRRSCRWCSMGQPRFVCPATYERLHIVMQGRAVHTCGSCTFPWLYCSDRGSGTKELCMPLAPTLYKRQYRGWVGWRW